MNSLLPQSPGTTSSLVPIEGYLRDCSRLSAAAFKARNPHPVLLYDGQGTITISGFRTGTVSMREAGENAPKRVTPVGVSVIPVAKRPGAIFNAQITVGRTRNTDIYLADPKISKLHAYFVLGGEGAQPVLYDAGSTNGTFVNNQRLLRDTPEALLEGAVIRFGSSNCVFYTADGFYEAVTTKRLPLRGP